MTLRAVLPVLLMGVAVVALVLLIHAAQSRKHNASDGRRRSLASARGWTYVQPAERALFRFEGTASGRRFRCEAFRPRPGDLVRQGEPQQTVVQTSLRGDGIAVLAPLGDGAARAIALTLVRATRGEPAARIAEHGERFALPGALSGRAEARVTNAALWREVEPAITRALTTIGADRDGVMLVWANDELSVSVGSFIEDERALEALIDASLALVAELSTRAGASHVDGGS